MQVVVLGCGPSGMLAAAACAEAGLDVAVVAPNLDTPWPNRYGVYVDELAPLGLDHVLAERWNAPIIALDAALSGPRAHVLQRPYARVDGEALRADCWRRLRVAGGRGVAAEVVAIGAAGDPVEALAGTVHTAARCRLADGRVLSAWVIVDARGAAGCGAGPRGRVDAWQVAWGEEIEVEGEGAASLTDGPMVLMDWSPPDRATQAAWAQQPSFLYAQPLGRGRAFVEETVLSARQPLALEVLRDRLARRLARRGVRVRVVTDVERCRLPMLMRPAAVEPGVLAWGARAGAIHPATGYMLAEVATRAPELAASLRASADAGLSSCEAAIAVYARMQPPSRARQEALLRFGGELLVDLDGPTIVRFFDAFFALPAERTAALLSRRGGVPALSATMARVFWAAPASIRQHLGRAGWQARGTLLPALVGGSLPPQESP